jgi:hypothetical protein
VANGEEPRPGPFLDPEQDDAKELAKWIKKAEKASYVILLSLEEGPLASKLNDVIQPVTESLNIPYSPTTMPPHPPIQHSTGSLEQTWR